MASHVFIDLKDLKIICLDSIYLSAVTFIRSESNTTNF